MSSYLPGGGQGPPQLVTVATPADDQQVVNLLRTDVGVSTQLESLYVDLVPGVPGWTDSPNAGIRIEWIDPTGEVIYAHTVYLANTD